MGGAGAALEGLMASQALWVGSRWTPGAALALSGVAIVLASLVVWLQRGARATHDLHKIPTPPGADLILGHAKFLTCPDYHNVVLQWSKDFGPLVRFRVLWETTVVVTDPAVAEQALGKVMQRSHAYSAIEKTLGHATLSLFATLDEEHWRNVRKTTAPAFAMANVRLYYPHLLRAAAEVLARFDAEQGALGYVDVDPHLLRMLLVVTMEGLFGLPDATQLEGFGALPHNIQHLTDEGNRHIADPLRKMLYWMPLGSLFSKRVAEGHAVERQVVAFNVRVAADILARPDPPASNTVLRAALHRLRHTRTGKRFTPQELAPEVSLYTVAAFDTTASTAGWCLYAAGRFPGEQEAVWAELQAAGLAGAGARAPSLEDLGRLPRLNAFINEVMRLFPAGAVSAERVATEPVTIAGLTVPAGTHFWAFQLGLHVSERNWEQPRDFRPQRWLDGKDVAYMPGAPSAAAEAAAAAHAAGEADMVAAAPVAAAAGQGTGTEQGEAGAGAGGEPGRGQGQGPRRFMPFSQGPKNCVGQNFAITVVRCVVVLMLARYRVELHPDMGSHEDVEKNTKVALTTKPKLLRLVLHRR